MSGASVAQWLERERLQLRAGCVHTRDGTLETLLHLFMLNRGVLITPFHSMLLRCPATSGADIDRYVSEVGAFCAQLQEHGASVTA
jgi:glutamate-1-semialdehyde 2,1-aminomutase